MKKLKGFTLIELMVVIAIIIILAAIAIPSYIAMTRRAQRSRATSDGAVIATSLEVYRTDKGYYPATTWEAMKLALTTDDNYISAATMGQIEASENLTTGPTYTTPDGKAWTITITTPDEQTGTRTSEVSTMTWGEMLPPAPGTYTVTFDTQGGSPTFAPESIPAGAFAILPPTPTKAGFIFTSWNTAIDGTGTTFGAPVIADITFYAIYVLTPPYVPVTYTVTFDTQGGIGIPAGAYVLIGIPAGAFAILPPTPTKAGFTFASWNTAPDGTGINFNFAAPVIADITFYAIYTTS